MDSFSKFFFKAMALKLIIKCWKNLKGIPIQRAWSINCVSQCSEIFWSLVKSLFLFCYQFHSNMVSLSLPLHSASKNVKVSLGSAETMAVYSNMIFSGWDFCINQRKAAKVKRKNIFTDIQVDVTAFYDI